VQIQYLQSLMNTADLLNCDLLFHLLPSALGMIVEEEINGVNWSIFVALICLRQRLH